MKRTFSFERGRAPLLVAGGTGLVAATYGLVRLAYGLYLPDVRADLPLDASAAGVIAGGASAMYCAAALTGFLLAVRAPRGLVVAAALSAAGGALGMASSPHVAAFAISAVIASAGAGLASPALVDLLGRTLDGARGRRAQVAVNSGTGHGLVLAGVLALVLLPDWRLAWTLAAVTTVVAAGVVLIATPRRGAPQRSGTGPVVPATAWFLAHARAITAALLLGAGSAAVWTFGRSVLAEAGAAPVVSASAWVCLGLGGVLVLPLSGALDRLGTRGAWVLTTAVGGAGTLTLGLLPGVVPLALAACVAFGWTYTAATGLLIVWTSELDAARAPTGTALLFVVLVLGQGAGSALTGGILGLAAPALAFGVAGLLSLAAGGPALSRGRGGPADPARDRRRDSRAAR